MKEIKLNKKLKKLLEKQGINKISLMLAKHVIKKSSQRDADRLKLKIPLISTFNLGYYVTMTSQPHGTMPIVILGFQYIPIPIFMTQLQV